MRPATPPSRRCPGGVREGDEEVEERLRDLERRRAREIEVNRARKAVRELLDWERRKSQELEESRAKRRSSAWRRPGRHCPVWLVTLFDSPNL